MYEDLTKYQFPFKKKKKPSKVSIIAGSTKPTSKRSLKKITRSANSIKDWLIKNKE
jgi:hypothetical protein